jgi:hypothetical protein
VMTDAVAVCGVWCVVCRTGTTSTYSRRKRRW